MIEEDIKLVIEKQERRKLLSELQAQAENEGHVPPMPFLYLRNMSQALQYGGGVFLGISLGLFSMLVNFIVFVMFLHMEF